MIREENTCLRNGTSSVQLLESTDSTLLEMNLIRMELQRGPTGHLQRGSLLYSMRHVCSPASGGMQWQHLCMCTTGPLLRPSLALLPSLCGMVPSQMFLIFAFLAALPMCTLRRTNESSCSPTLKNASSLAILPITRRGSSGIQSPRRR